MPSLSTFQKRYGKNVKKEWNAYIRAYRLKHLKQQRLYHKKYMRKLRKARKAAKNKDKKGY